MNQSKRDFIPPVTCVRCGKELESIDHEEKKTYGMVSGGVVGVLYAPYGSRNDGTIYQIGICDDCIDEVKLVPIGDYMFADHDQEIRHQVKMKEFEKTGTYITGEG